jgi:hypothetical protein
MCLKIRCDGKSWKILQNFGNYTALGARPGSPAPGVPNDQIQCTVRRSRRCVDRVLTYHEMHVRRPCWPAWIIIIIFLVRNQASSSGWLRTIHVPQHCTVWLCHSSRGEWWRLWIVSALGSIGMSVSCEDSSAALAKCQTHEKRGHCVAQRPKRSATGSTSTTFTQPK